MTDVHGRVVHEILGARIEIADVTIASTECDVETQQSALAIHNSGATLTGL